jgi:hypothetical protein
LASPHGNTFILQKFAVRHSFWPLGMWDFHPATSSRGTDITSFMGMLMYFKLASIHFCFESVPVPMYFPCDVGKYKSYTAEFEVKIIKVAQQNRNRAVERELSVNELHIHYWHKHKEVLCRVKCSTLEHSGPPKRKISLASKKTI